MTEERLRILEIILAQEALPSLATFQSLLREIRGLRAENVELRLQIQGHAACSAAQSELLSQRAEKPPEHKKQIGTLCGFPVYESNDIKAPGWAKNIVLGAPSPSREDQRAEKP